jgi:DNA-binding HxlR family transcriptional regulator
VPGIEPRPAPSRSGTRAKRAQQRRSVCPVACTLDLIGDRWTLLIVRDLMSGKSHFKEFLASPEGIATNILAERLARLTDSGLVERHPSGDVGGRDVYRLTQSGRALRGVMAQIKAWGLRHIDGTEARVQLRD